jgi:hypothetical protein
MFLDAPDFVNAPARSFALPSARGAASVRCMPRRAFCVVRDGRSPMAVVGPPFFRGTFAWRFRHANAACILGLRAFAVGLWGPGAGGLRARAVACG